MKILKYFSLLLLLTFISLIVFILTQSGTFKINKTFELDASQSIVYNYLNNLNNWKDWMDLKQIDANTYSLELNDLGTFGIKKEYSYPYDSISQDILNDTKLSNIVWRFNSKQDKTVVNLTFEGNLDIKTKILTFFSGSPDKVVEKALERNVNSLIVFFIKQYKEYTLETNGNKNQKALSYIYVEANTNYTNLKATIAKLDLELKGFSDKNALKLSGSPLLLINTSDTNHKIEFQYGYAIQDSIFLNDEEKYKLGTLLADNYFESTVIGYYTHLPKALAEIYKVINKSEVFNIDNNKKAILKLDESSLNHRLPSEWKTTILIPISSKEIITPVYNYKNYNTTTLNSINNTSDDKVIITKE